MRPILVTSPALTSMGQSKSTLSSTVARQTFFLGSQAPSRSPMRFQPVGRKLRIVHQFAPERGTRREYAPLP